MESIGECLKQMATRNFKYVSVFERNGDTILKTLNTGVHESDNMIVFPQVSKVEVTKIDELHDEVKLLWSDIEVKGVMTWKKGKNVYSLISFT